MKKLFYSICLLFSAISTQAETPAVTMTTSNALGSTFSFDIAAIADNTPIQVDWGNGTLSNYMIGAIFPLSISEILLDNTIKIYGTGISYLFVSNKNLTMLDVSKCITLTRLSCDVNQLTTLDVSNNTELKVLYCYRNQLTALDVSNNTALTDLFCSDNQLTALNVSKNTSLETLWCVSNQLTALDVSKNSALITLLGYNNQLNALDISNNTALTELECTLNQLTTLDVSKNSALITLKCAHNQLNALDVSKNTSLETLWCCDNKITVLDVSNNTALETLWCYGNQLTALVVSKNTALIDLKCNNNHINALDVSNNTALTGLVCNSNQLTALDISKNTKLTTLDCSSNHLTFSTLPIKQPTWTTYNYSPQAVLKLSKNKYSIIEEIDLRNEFTHGGTNTVYIWKTVGGIILVKDIEYTEDNGKFTFIKAQVDKVFCQMNNTSLPLLTQTTENITILPTTPTLTFSTSNSVASTISFSVSSTFNNSLIQLDWGNGILNDYTISSSGSNISGLLTGSTINVYGIGISNINLSSKNITTLDVSEATFLKTLNCSSNKLNTLDLSKDTSLTSVSCQSNNFDFTTLPLKQSDWTTYTYSPQAAMVLQKKNYTHSETIDLSSQLTANSNTTNYLWKTKGGTILTSGTDYSTINGVTTFLKAQTDSVYCQMTNATFPSLTLSTTNIKVSDPTSINSDLEQTTTVYPNPVNNQLWVNSEETIRKVEIYSIVGNKVFEQDYNNTQTLNINSDEFPKGLLIIKVYGANGVMERKVIKE